jgi:transposase
MIEQKYSLLKSRLDERGRRLWAAAEALSFGSRGISAVSRATGLSRTTISSGIAELKEDKPSPAGGEIKVKGSARPRIRAAGGGRKSAQVHDPKLLIELEKLVDPTSRGDPECVLRWTCKSVRNLAQELNAKGHPTSHRMVAEMLHQLKYSLQANAKNKEGSKHPDRDAQFRHIFDLVEQMQGAGQPVISVDTKKKELVGDFKNGGREWQPQGKPEQVQVHDFPDRELGKVSPYGVYDLQNNEGWVNVGTDHDTSTFAVESIRRWWLGMGKAAYPAAEQLLITADGGGSNGSRVRLWKLELQRLANETGLVIKVSHFPPGTSKWNKIEHRLFSFISMNWRGKPLVNHEVIVQLIAGTKNTTGLKVSAALDQGKYPKGKKVSKQEMERLNLLRNDFHGEWNYQISPLVESESP